MFSHYITYLFEKLSFYKVVAARFLIILFRWKKNIDLLQLNYDTEHLFENGYIIINYRFRNAIYYTFGKHKTLEKQIKIFNLKNIEEEIELIAHGIFGRKVKTKLILKPELTLNADNFKTNISNLNLKLFEKQLPKLSPKEIYCDIKKPNIAIPEIKVKNKKIKISNTTFNQNDFI